LLIEVVAHVGNNSIQRRKMLRDASSKLRVDRWRGEAEKGEDEDVGHYQSSMLNCRVQEDLFLGT
jgi:hypothetical protein